MSNDKISHGVTMLQYYHVLRDEEVKKMIDNPRHQFRQAPESDIPNTEQWRSEKFLNAGLTVTLASINGSRWGLYAKLCPSIILRSGTKSGLYDPGASDYEELCAQSNDLLARLGSPYYLADMTLMLAEFAVELKLPSEEAVQRYLGLMQEAYKPKAYQPTLKESKSISFGHDKTIFDGADIPKRAYGKFFSKRAAFYAYGKAAQQRMEGRFPTHLIGKKTLRMEVQLRTRAMKRKVGKIVWKHPDQVLEVLEGCSVDMVRQRLKRMKLLVGDHMPYDGAMALVAAKASGETADQMRHLLKAAHENENLTSAIRIMKDQYNLSNRQIGKLMKRFRRLGISPITLSDTVTEHLPSLGALLEGGNAAS